MNRFSIILILFAITTRALSQNVTYTNLTSLQFQNKISTGKVTVLDVRTPSEYANGHLPNSGQLNYYAFDFNRKLLLLAKDQPVYLYCNTGWRSQKAAEILAENGYTQVYNLEKGIMDWELNDYPVKVNPNAKADNKDKMEPDEFYALINSQKPVFIDFYAPWCGPCRKMMPMIDSLKTEYKGKITLVKINADASKKLVKELQLGSVPYLVLYQKGKKQFEHHGIITRMNLESKLTVN